MPRSSPSTSPARADNRIVEVVEVDRVVDELPPLPVAEGGQQPNRLAILLGIVVLAVLGLSLLPARPIEPNSADATLPDPAVATTLIGNEPRNLGFIADETFPIFVASGLKGFVSLTAPVAFDDRWWIVGNRPEGVTEVMVSEDSRLWRHHGEISPPPGTSIRIDHLTSIDDVLVAAGTQGTLIGPDFMSVLAGSVQLWRSSDGRRWVPEVVHPAGVDTAFVGIALATSGETLVVQAEGGSTTAARAALRLPAEISPGLESGRLHLEMQGTRLAAYGPLGIELVVVPADQVAVFPRQRLFRSDSFGTWEETPINVTIFGQVVASPDGGFIFATIEGAAYTSAYGVTWGRNPVADGDRLLAWDDKLVTFDHRGEMEVIDGEQTRSLVLPEEVAGCWIAGSNDLLAATCGGAQFGRPAQIPWNGWELSLRRGGLEVRDPSTGRIRHFVLGPVQGVYDPGTDTIALEDLNRSTLAFPVEVLDRLEGATDSSHVLFLSADGLAWSRGQISLRGDRLLLLGGVEDGFLVATGGSQPRATLTVLAADF